MNLLAGHIPESLLNVSFQVSIIVAIIWIVSLLTKRASTHKNFRIMKRLSMLSFIGLILISMVGITNANAQNNGTSAVKSGNNSKKNIEKTKTATKKPPVSEEKISNKWITVSIDKNGGYEIEGYLKADYKNIETVLKNTMLTTKKTSILIITDDNAPMKYYQYLNDVALKCGAAGLSHKRTPLNMEKK
jgi:hypothetical protein